MKPAARLTDLHVCPMVIPGTPPIPHVGGPVTSPGSANVVIGGMPAARVSDQCMCIVVGIPDPIAVGSVTVKINAMPAARLGDSTSHGGIIITGFPTVLIGDGSAAGAGGAGAANAADGPPAGPVSPLASGQALTAPQRQAQAMRAAAAAGAAFCEACRREQLVKQAIPRKDPILTKDLRAELAEPPLADKCFKPDGTLAWPPNDGFDGPLVPTVLRKGMWFDRYSKKVEEKDDGRFLSVPGTAYEERALPYKEGSLGHRVYEVVEDIPVMAGTSASAFNQPGGAVQYRSSMTVKELLKSGKIRVVK